MGTLLRKRIILNHLFLFVITHPHGVSQIQKNCVQINAGHSFFAKLSKKLSLLFFVIFYEIKYELTFIIGISKNLQLRNVVNFNSKDSFLLYKNI